MEWMSPMDASFLHLEGPMNPMHIGGVSIFGGPAPPFERLEEMVAGKLGLVPRYRQKVRFVPLGLGRPVWVDDPHFNLSYHLRHSALPAPGSNEQLRRTAARIFAQRLARGKPLWEIWMLEGLGESRWALLSKVHHCMVDGVSATDLMSVMFEGEGAPATGATWEPAPEPSGAELVLRTLTRRTLNPSEQLRSVRAAARAPRASLVQALDLLRGMTSAAGVLRPPGGSSLTGPVGPHRTWSWAHVRLSDVKSVRAALGGTVNDVVLTIVSGGLRDLLEARGERVADRTIRTLVPVSVRRAADRYLRPGSTSRRCACADGRPQAVKAGDRRRRAYLTLGLRPADAAGARRPPRRALSVARRADRHHERAGTPTAPAHPRTKTARVVSLRPRDRPRANLDRDLLLRRRPLPRRHRRLRQLERHRHPHHRRGAVDGRAARTRRAAANEPNAGQAGEGHRRGRPAGSVTAPTPHELKELWLNRAIERAGIDRDRWDPARGVDENRPTIEAVYDYYGRLFLEHPHLEWAGMASTIGPAFYAGFKDLGMLPDALRRVAIALFGRASRRLATRLAGDLGFYETTFLTMQKQIFEDQAPMHEAYVAGGEE